jgi:Calcineurin-like phosphoesterase
MAGRLLSRTGENDMDQADQKQQFQSNRRTFIRQGTLMFAGSAVLANNVFGLAEEKDGKPKLRIGLVTDLHYADKPPAGTRYYRETLAKFSEAAKRFQQEKVDCVIALGDVIDSADSLEIEKGYLRRIAKEFSGVPGEHHYVLGNHCVTALTKPEFLKIVGQEKSYYSFNLGGYHFIVLDACFRGDGEPYGRKNFDWTDANIPKQEVEWLRSDLQRTPNKALVFVHQRLDVKPPLGIKNAGEVRKVLEESGKVLGVFQGHDHKGGYQELGGIHYCTLSAMIEGSGSENSAYAILHILPGDVIRITGVRKQKSNQWSR